MPPDRDRRSVWFFRAAIGFTLIGTLILYPTFDGMLWPLAMLVIVIGAVVLRPTISTAQAEMSLPEAMPLDEMRGWHMGAFVVGFVLLTLLALRSTPVLQGPLSGLNMHIQHLLLWIGIGSISLGLGAASWRRPRVTHTVWIVVTVTVLALILRLVRLGSHLTFMPDGWIFAWAVADFDPARSILSQVSLYATSTWVFVYWQAMVSEWVGGGTFGLRMVSALVGTATVAATGFLAHELFDARRDNRRQWLPMSVVSALILATFPAHLHYSRLSLYNIADPFFGVMAAALLARAFRKQDRYLYVLAGVFLGLTAYFYEAGKLMFPVLMLAWGLGVVWLRVHRGAGRGLLLMVIAALIVGIPPWFTMAVEGDSALTRLQVGGLANQRVPSSEAPWREYLGNLPESALMITTTPDGFRAPFFGTTQGLVPIWWLPFFLLGLMRVLARPLGAGHLLILLWIGATIAGTALLENQISPRFVIVLPILAVTCALGLDVVLNMRGREGGVTRIARSIVIVALCIWSAVHYLAVHVPELNSRRNDLVRSLEPYDLEDVVQRMEGVPAGNQVILLAWSHSEIFTNRVFLEWVRYYNEAIVPERILIDDIIEEKLSELSVTTNRTFFIEPWDAETLALLETTYVLSAPGYTDNPDVRDIALVQFDVLALRGQ